MPKPYDAALKDLIAAFPADWLDALGLPATGPVEVLSADLSTVTAAADILLGTGDAVVHIDAQSGPDPDLANRLLLYNVLARRKAGLPVHSVAVLLRSEANIPAGANEVRYSAHPAGELTFRFEVMRLWQTPMSELMARGVGLLPLAVLGKMPAGQTRRQALPGVLEGIAERTAHELPADRAARVVSAAMILAGMHLDHDTMREIVRRSPAMIQSTTYDVIEEFGGIAALKRVLLKQGRELFGEPTPEQAQKLQAIDDLPRLERLVSRVLKVKTWDALLRGR